ncbi:DNA primase [Candidatus Nomurabacteria bacterium]|nr:DNA primase [Candidatus Nomurabacteria bacterium]
MSDTQLIKQKIDIVDLIGEYIELKPAGINHKGLCPFHGEKTPSFMVNRDRQRWHCFGCNKGGDAFTFVEEIEGLEFVEALKLLAQKAGVELADFKQDIHKSQKNRIKEINLEASRFYYNFLTKLDAAKSAREYLAKRGLSDQTIEKWQIGFVVDQWDLLTKYLLKKGYSIDDLVASGLTIKREGASSQSMKGFYDRFRGRIIFPIRNVHGDVVGFTARILVETEDSGGKYINTPQTLVFDKSQVVFGLHFAKQAIRKKNLAIFVEGQTDVISCHQNGSENVVATSGTALTEGHIHLIKRYSKNIAFSFDSDSAGVSAAKRAIGIALEAGMSVKIIQIDPDYGKDPDEVIKKHPELWQRCVDNAKDVMQWYFDMAFSDKNLSDPKQKQAAADELLPEIQKIQYAVERSHWVSQLSALLAVDIKVLEEDMKRLTRKTPLATTQAKPENLESRPERTRSDELSEAIFALLLKYPEAGSVEFLVSLEAQLATYPLYERLLSMYNAGQADIEAFRHQYPQSDILDLVEILLMKAELDFGHLSKAQASSEIRSLSEQLKNTWLKQRRAQLQQEISQAEQAGDHQKLQSLLEQFSQLN